jgi:sugar transferase (PEP-CTERM/EpsH1 system associated)
VCCLHEAGEFAGRIRHPGVAVHVMGSRGGNDLALAFRLARLFRRNGTDIVHTRNAESFYYGVLGARLAGVPCVVHSEHGRTFLDRRIRWHVQRFLTRFTDAVFSVSEQLRADLVSHIGIPATAIQVLYNGVDLARFGQGCDREAWRARWGVAPGRLVVGSVGRLVPVKNYGLLLRAAAAVPEIVVVLAGDGPQREALQEQAARLGIADRVRLLGHREDVDTLLGAFDLFVLPSLSEGMSNTLLEAMAAGVCPVVSDVGGNREIVRDGIEGCLFPSEDESALRQRLRELVADADLRARLARAARERVMAAFDIDAMVRRYADLYTRVMAAHAGPGTRYAGASLPR